MQIQDVADVHSELDGSVAPVGDLPGPAGEEFPTQAPASVDRCDFVVCLAHGDHVAFALEDVDEVVPVAKLKRLPDAPAWVCGSLNLRGEPIPVVSIEARLARTEAAPDPYDVILVCWVNGERVGFVVPEVVDVMNFEKSAIRRPNGNFPHATYLTGVVPHEGNQILLFNPGLLASRTSAPEA